MTAPTTQEMLSFLKEHGFLPARLSPLDGDDSANVFADPRSLARALVERDVLTPYQAKQILLGHGEELLMGPYRILDLLGEGGMGRVFKAHHVSMDRTIALKVIAKNRVSNPIAVERFYREVRAVARLSHPNVVIAFEANNFGETHFLAMEYVAGIDLARLVAQSGPLPVASACEYIRQAAIGLQHAHEKGLVHRDIKPGNLMVARPHPDELPVVKILDFGLARFESESASAERLTQLGKIVGTVDYIAPEQAQNARTADIRADIYSLGCSLFFLLTGKPPFPGKDVAEKLSARVMGDIPSLSIARPDVSPALERVVAKMMARNPADRYQTPDEVAKALEVHTEAKQKAALTDTPASLIPTKTAPVPTEPSTPESDTAPSVSNKRNPTAPSHRSMVAVAVMAIVALFLLALVVGGGAVYWLGSNGGLGHSGTQAEAKSSQPDGPTAPAPALPKTKAALQPNNPMPIQESKKEEVRKGPVKVNLGPNKQTPIQESKKEESPKSPAKNGPTSWKSVASIPTARSLLATVTGLDGRIYAIGGENANGRLDTVEVYDPNTNTWAKAAPMPTARNHLAASVGPNGLIYAIGGVSKSPGIVESYNPSTNKWTTVARIPTVRHGLAAATGPDGRIYAIGGSGTSGSLGTVEAYDTKSNTWTTVASMPTARVYLAAATGPDGRIYVIGGFQDSGKRLNTVEAYDTKTNKWATVASMPTARNALAAATGLDGRIYVIGGHADGGILNLVEAYDTKTNKWATVASMPTLRGQLAATTGHDGRVFVIGGGNVSFLNTVEALSFSANK